MYATTADSPGVAGLKYALGRKNSGKSSQGIPSFSSLHQLLSSDSLQANLLRKCKFPSHWVGYCFIILFLKMSQITTSYPCEIKLFLEACLPDTYNAMEMPPPGTDGSPLQVGCSVFKLPFYIISTSICYIKPYMRELMIICPYNGQVQYSAIFAIFLCLSC